MITDSNIFKISDCNAPSLFSTFYQNESLRNLRFKTSHRFVVLSEFKFFLAELELESEVCAKERRNEGNEVFEILLGAFSWQASA